jgi:hypothetical protein
MTDQWIDWQKQFIAAVEQYDRECDDHTAFRDAIRDALLDILGHAAVNGHVLDRDCQGVSLTQCPVNAVRASEIDAVLERFNLLKDDEMQSPVVIVKIEADAAYWAKTNAPNVYETYGWKIAEQIIDKGHGLLP